MGSAPLAPAKPNRRERRKALLNCLHLHPDGVTYSQLREYAEQGRLPYGGTYRTLQFDLNWLQRHGFICRTGNTNQNRYHFTATDSRRMPVQSGCTQPDSAKACATSVAFDIRDCFGNGLLVATSGGYGIEAVGLHKPLQLTFADDTPDLSSSCGQVITYSGLLPLIKGNLEELSIQAVDIQLSDDPAITKVWAVVTGNLGKAPEVNPKGDRVGASIAYADNAWLRLTAYAYFSCTDKFKELDAGKRVIVYGALESYTYRDSDRLQLCVQGFGLLSSAGGSRKPSVLYSSPNPSHGEVIDTDAITAA